jgi:hypothetical protein
MELHPACATLAAGGSLRLHSRVRRISRIAYRGSCRMQGMPVPQVQEREEHVSRVRESLWRGGICPRGGVDRRACAGVTVRRHAPRQCAPARSVLKRLPPYRCPA